MSNINEDYGLATHYHDDLTKQFQTFISTLADLSKPESKFQIPPKYTKFIQVTDTNSYSAKLTILGRPYMMEFNMVRCAEDQGYAGQIELFRIEYDDKRATTTCFKFYFDHHGNYSDTGCTSSKENNFNSANNIALLCQRLTLIEANKLDFTKVDEK